MMTARRSIRPWSRSLAFASPVALTMIRMRKFVAPLPDPINKGGKNSDVVLIRKKIDVKLFRVKEVAYPIIPNDR